MAPVPPPPPKLQVSVVNGNLRFIGEPLMLGHYRSIALTGTERVMNDLIGNAMATALRLEQYPERPGTHEVFINSNQPDPLRLPRPQAVIVVGLGDEGTLRATELTRTVRHGVIAWAKHAASKSGAAPENFEFATTLIGSGGTGISAGQSAALVVEGVLAANKRLTGSGWPLVKRVSLIELYLDRATEAWLTLRAEGVAGPEEYALDEVIATGVGALSRPPDGGYRGARYDMITAMTVQGERGDDGIAYVADSRRARTEVHAQALQRPLLRELIARASNQRKYDPRIRGTLFRLLVPAELEPFLTGTTDAVIELDRGTAGIPWEILDPASGTDRSDGTLPWAIRARLLRKLRTERFRPQVVDATTESAMLIIGEPACDDPSYPPLPGAREEASVVATCLAKTFDPSKVKGLFSKEASGPGPTAEAVINTLLERDWRVVHIAGHGDVPEPAAGPTTTQDPDQPDVVNAGGVVLSGRIRLGAREIRSMRVVPELVFVNCCHLAARDAGELLREDTWGAKGRYDRARFAANVAEALISVGVRCVVAAGWAVEDGAAKAFATTFYEQLVGRRRFIDAVAEARRAAYAKGGNTWAAYQCYGDPDWTFVRDDTDRPQQQQPTKPGAAYAGVASPAALTLALTTLTINSDFDKSDPEERREKVCHLEGRFARRWGGMGAVAEAFGAAWAASRDLPRAIGWYRCALEANDGGASLRAAEQLGNLQARLAWETLEAWKPAEGEAGAEAALAKKVDDARLEIRDALKLLQHLADDVQSSIERESMCGSAWKRLAMVEARAGRPEAELAAFAAMRDRYAKAEALARSTRGPGRYYPALNRIAAELITEMGNDGWAGFDPDDLEDVRASLEARVADDPDFWSVVSRADLRFYEAVARKDLAGARTAVEDEYRDVYRRAGSDLSWASVSDQLDFVLAKYDALPDTAFPAGTAAEREASAALRALVRGYAAMTKADRG